MNISGHKLSDNDADNSIASLELRRLRVDLVTRPCELEPKNQRYKANHSDGEEQLCPVSNAVDAELDVIGQSHARIAHL